MAGMMLTNGNSASSYTPPAAAAAQQELNHKIYTEEWSSRNVITIIKVWTEHFHCVCQYEEWGLITQLSLLCCSKNISHVDSHTHLNLPPSDHTRTVTLSLASHLWNTSSSVCVRVCFELVA